MFKKFILWLLRKRTTIFKTAVKISDEENAHVKYFGDNFTKYYIQKILSSQIADELLEKGLIKITTINDVSRLQTTIEAEIRVIK